MRTQVGQSLKAKTSTGPGDAVAMERPTDRFSIACTIAGTTKCAVRLQGSIDGQNWTNIGAAASTYTSSDDGRIDNSTSNRLVAMVRLNVTANAGAQAINGWVAGKGA